MMLALNLSDWAVEAPTANTPGSARGLFNGPRLVARGRQHRHIVPMGDADRVREVLGLVGAWWDRRGER
jgi:hypothetical protein